jgi:hypothetical protein
VRREAESVLRKASNAEESAKRVSVLSEEAKERVEELKTVAEQHRVVR